MSRLVFSIQKMENLETTGSKIRKLREQSNMPLRKLAALLDLDQSTLSKIERNTRRSSIQQIEKICEIFNINKRELLISFYSDAICYEIQDEDQFAEILHLAEEKIEYKRAKPRQ